MTGRRRALMLEHDTYSLPGSYLEGLRECDFDVVEHRVDVHPDLPDPRKFDTLLVMGSLWSVYDETIRSWFDREVRAIRQAVDARVPVLGVCFGAQALSHALGGEVRRAPESEIGWTAVETEDRDRIDSGPWFQWHHDRFTLPPGGRTLARNPMGIQAYDVGPHLGVQFHPEITLEIARTWLREGSEDLQQAGVDPEAVLNQTKYIWLERREAALHLLHRFLEGVPFDSYPLAHR